MTVNDARVRVCLSHIYSETCASKHQKPWPFAALRTAFIDEPCNDVSTEPEPAVQVCRQERAALDRHSPRPHCNPKTTPAVCHGLLKHIGSLSLSTESEFGCHFACGRWTSMYTRRPRQTHTPQRAHHRHLDRTLPETPLRASPLKVCLFPVPRSSDREGRDVGWRPWQSRRPCESPLPSSHPT